MYRGYGMFAEENEQLPPNAYAYAEYIQKASCLAKKYIQVRRVVIPPRVE